MIYALKTRPPRTPYLIDLIRIVAASFLGIYLISVSTIVFAESNENLTEIDIESLLSKEVITASKIVQQVSDSPSAVSIITAKDIKSYGYRTLAEIINSMRGLNTSSDHVYTYMSGRGFGRSGDYPGRVMLLIDGYQGNDNLYNASYLASDGLLDTELIERVEYVSGPGAVIYGNGAFYGIINVITKKGSDFGGLQVAIDAQSHDGYKGRITYGNKLDNGANVLLSVSGFHSQGQDLYFSAFDTPATNFGVANNQDEDKNRRLFFKANYQNWSLESAYVSRKKDDPAASYGTDFNSKPGYLQDTNAFINLKHEVELSQNLKNASRLYYGQYMYSAKSTSSGEPFAENDMGRWWGAQTTFAYTGFANQQLVYGFEYHSDYQQDFYLPTGNIKHDSYMWSGYLQDEYRLNNEWAINAGVRADYGGKNASDISPRIAAIYSPTTDIDIKASYSTAFRRPNQYEKYYDDAGDSQLANPDVKKEQVSASELVFEYRPDNFSKFLSSLFFYRTKNLIEVEDSTVLPGLLQAQNAGTNKTRGFDFEYERKLSTSSRIRASYAWQYARDDGGKWLVNSPKNLAKLNYAQALFNNNLHTGIEVQYVGKRLTEQLNILGSYVVTNLSLYNTTFIKNTTISASVKNLFNKHYSVAAPDFYTPDSFEQDNRNFWLQLTYDFR
ncbi:MAG: TonB-dependent receptor [Methylotenera sp.]|uniref:TonB-dependent receptor plug domain-containing protein n=1 Tax=Methylotenera sp. TaxID=2051956 RepID=UPI002487A1C0|nr:TonB-dependent receptor [Methylotenera sp.]MDI1308838.1 TonB-dependent receptor [Methylotenera sp.]